VYEPVLKRTDLPGVPGAADALNGLYYKYGDPLLFITARRKQFADAVRTSLGNLLNPDVEFTVLYTADNHEDEARNDKLDLLKKYKVKLFVEDNALHWEQYIDNGIKIATLDWPWTFGQVMELRSRGKKIEMYSDWRGLHSYLDKFVENVNGRNK
jgi:hypothetical protein